MNQHTLKPSDRFGPLPFKVSASSHSHHLSYLERCLPTYLGDDSVFLYPFEFWPLPRVLSQWHFGRLNEVISIRAERVVHTRPRPEQELIGETTVKSVSVQHGLCFSFFESVTRTAAGDICMVATDALLLASGCDVTRLHEAVSQVARNEIVAQGQDAQGILGSWVLQMRYPWPIGKWHNNIHTDVYARSLGYERALVEGPGIADVVCCAHKAQNSSSKAFRISWNYAGPLYENTPVVLVPEATRKPHLRRYQVCISPHQLPGKTRVLINLEVEDL